MLEFNDVEIQLVTARDEEENEVVQVRFGDRNGLVEEVASAFGDASAVKITVLHSDGGYRSSYGPFSVVVRETDDGEESFISIQDIESPIEHQLEEDYDGEICTVQFEEAEQDVEVW